MMVQSSLEPMGFEPTLLQRTTRTCLMVAKFKNSIETPSDEALDDLKRKLRLLESELKLMKKEMSKEITSNEELIEHLRIELDEKRRFRVAPGVNEVLVRRALKNYHPGGNIFQTKEPRDVNDEVDFKTSDLIGKRDRLRYTKRMRQNCLREKLVLLNEAAEDVVYLELEGPMGDSRCLTLENHIANIGKKIQQAEMVHASFENIRDELIIDSRVNDLAIDTAKKMIAEQNEYLCSIIKRLEIAVQHRRAAIAISIKVETDFRQKRKGRHFAVMDLKKESDDLKRELNQLSKSVQLFFAHQEAMHLGRIGHVTSTTMNLADASSEQARWTLQDMERDAQILADCTGTHTIEEVQSRFEHQRDTQLDLQSLARKQELEKRDCLQRLEQLQVIRDSRTFAGEQPLDVQLRDAGQREREASESASQQRRSTEAACSRVAQSLARMRQLLEYLVEALATAGLMERPPGHLRSLDTADYLPALMKLASGGVAQLMVAVGRVEPERARQHTELARLLMTRSEVKLSMHVQPAILKSHTLRSQISDEGETTGSDMWVTSRSVMKQRADHIVHAKLKAGYGKKKFIW